MRTTIYSLLKVYFHDIVVTLYAVDSKLALAILFGQ